MFGKPPDPALPVPPAAPPNPPIFGQDAAQRKPGRKSMNPTFLGSQAAANPTNTGMQTLLGA